MLLIFKLLLVPLIIGLVTLAGCIWGGFVSGLLGGLPIVAGPILIFLAIDHGTEFATVSAYAALAAVISIGLFSFTYAISSLKFGVMYCLIFGILAFISSTIVLNMLDLTPMVTLTVVLLVLSLLLYEFPYFTHAEMEMNINANQIILRMIAGASLIFSITYCSDLLGPQVSGLLTPFPIIGTILAGFTHYNYGDNAVRQLLKGFMKGLFGMAVFNFTFASQLDSLGIGLSASLSLCLAILASGIINIRIGKRISAIH